MLFMSHSVVSNVTPGNKMSIELSWNGLKDQLNSHLILCCIVTSNKVPVNTPNQQLIFPTLNFKSWNDQHFKFDNFYWK